MSRTFDVVVEGDPDGALVQLVSDQLRKGQRTLVVLGTGDLVTVHRFRRRMLATAGAGVRLTVMGNAEVVCIAGTKHPEAVVIRRRASGRLVAVNTVAAIKQGTAGFRRLAPDQDHVQSGS